MCCLEMALQRLRTQLDRLRHDPISEEPRLQTLLVYACGLHGADTRQHTQAGQECIRSISVGGLFAALLTSLQVRVLQRQREGSRFVTAPVRHWRAGRI